MATVRTPAALLLLIMLGVASAVPMAAQEGDHASAIRALRAQSNDAIARHDVPGILSFLDETVHVTAGSGAMISGAEAMGQAFREQFDRFEGVNYVRTAESVEVGEAAGRAAESGTWVGTWTTPQGPVRTGGRYAAYWRNVDGTWRIRSELFVTLFCEGAGCA